MAHKDMHIYNNSLFFLLFEELPHLCEFAKFDLWKAFVIPVEWKEYWTFINPTQPYILAEKDGSGSLGEGIAYIHAVSCSNCNCVLKKPLYKITS